MLRKLLTFFLVFLLLGHLAGCGKGTSSQPETAATEKIGTEEQMPTVEITLPAMLFESQEDFDPEAYARENGFLSAVENEDGSITVTMSKQRQELVLKETAQAVEESFGALIQGESTPYIKDISYNHDFSEVTMVVDKAAYERAFDMTPLAIALSSAMYQSLSGVEFLLTLDIVDEATEEIIQTVCYPEAG